MKLVTGGTGLLGAHVLFDLLMEGHEVRAIKRPSSKLQLTRKIFSYYSDQALTLFNKIEWVNADVLDLFSLEEAFNNISDVYHCAGFVSFDPRDREMLLKINAQGTANMVNTALEKDIRKFCHVSSVSALGRSENKGTIDEEAIWKSYRNKSPYAISKYEGEREVWRGIVEGLNAVIVNPSIIIGPGNWDEGSSRLFTSVWNGLKFYTTGINGFVDVRDVSRIMIQLMNTNISGERFVVNASSVSYKHIFELIAKELNASPPTYHATRFLSNIAWRIEKIRGILQNKSPLITRETSRTANNKYYFSNQKVKQNLHHEFISIEDSIKDTARHFLSEQT
ncbi:MAG: NAD-dependent epimerase/dehydratase family protein [Bacteroidales bacterium]|nr:NAD-dependent epimerase/dehydratase family protein [Bacteroidales bacterium]